MAEERYPPDQGQRYCMTCGALLEPQARFCMACGAVVDSTGPPPFDPAFASGPREVPNYLVQAILVTIFCCLPLGIVAIVFSAQVNGKLASGDYAGAVSSSNTAKILCWISFGMGLVVLLIYIGSCAADFARLAGL